MFKQLPLLLLLNTALLSINAAAPVAQAQTTSRNTQSQRRPAPPKRIPPNKVKPGGGLDFARQACTQDNRSLVALVPVENPVTTTQPNPSFLFYIPDRATAILYGEFSLLTADDKTRIYETSVTLEHTPGIIKIDLPQDSQYALEVGKLYHWYFKIHCQNHPNSSFSLNVDGWVQRVPLTPARRLKIETASPDIWYDSLVRVAEKLLASPQNLETRDRWQHLLQHINLEYLRETPLVETFNDRYSLEETEKTNIKFKLDE